MTRSSGSTTAARNSGGSTDLSPWILGWRGRDLPPPLAGAVRDGRISGLILFRDNLGDSVRSAREVVREIRGLAGGRPFALVIDEEGGLISQTTGMEVARGRRWPGLPSPRALGRIGSAEESRWCGEVLGRRLRGLGIGLDLAPSLDLDTEASNPVIGSRAFGGDPDSVAGLGASFAEGLRVAGVGACYKHYPGHGGTVEDSHKTLPRMDVAARTIHERPFRSCLGARTEADPGAPWVMTAHIDWGDGTPVSLDPIGIGRLRRMAPRTIRITDALDMAAVDLAGDAGRRALLAGNDVLLVGRDHAAGLAAVRRLEDVRGSDAAVARAWARTRRRRAPVWDLRFAGDGGGEGIPAEDLRRLGRLHRSAVRLVRSPAPSATDASPDSLPEGPWVWILPEGLAPYVHLRGWTPPKTRRRFCQEIVWVPERASPSFVRELARRLAREQRPLLWATLFRGTPAKEVREAWERMLRLRGLRVVAHLLDERWPSVSRISDPAADPGHGASYVTAQTSGPSREALTGLAEALDPRSGG